MEEKNITQQNLPESELATIPLVAHETTVARLCAEHSKERKHDHLVTIILIVLLFVTNIAWMIHDVMIETTISYVAEATTDDLGNAHATNKGAVNGNESNGQNDQNTNT